MENQATQATASGDHRGHWYRPNHEDSTGTPPRTIQALHNEHAYMFNLLDSLAEQVALIGSGDEADFSLLLDIVDYMQNFPERFHHPKEDLIYQRMALRDDQFAREVTGLMDEHKQLERLMDRLANAIKDVHTMPTVLKKQRAAQLCEEYEAGMRSHILNEEERIFPLAVLVLREEDWFLIDQQSTPINEIPIDNILTDNYSAMRRMFIGGAEKLANNVVLAEFLGSHSLLEFIGGIGVNVNYGREAYSEGVKASWNSYIQACKSWNPLAQLDGERKFRNPWRESMTAFVDGMASVPRPEAELVEPMKRALNLYSALVSGSGKPLEIPAIEDDEQEIDLNSMRFLEDISRLVQ